MVSSYRILIVEDDPLVALDLETIVDEVIASDVVIRTSVADAMVALSTHFDFALLDVDVTNGKTYKIASSLTDRDIPFAFVTASERDKVPEFLRAAPFIAKPFTARDIASLLANAGKSPGTGHA